MTKKTNASKEATTEVKATTPTIDSGADIETGFTRERSKRRKVYERPRESEIPQEIHDLFAKDNYEVRGIKWSINGNEDYRYLARREREGYEFIKASELPEWYLKQLRVKDTGSSQGLVTMGDLCLMKIDIDLRNDRRRYYAQETSKQVAAVDVNVLEKKGFKNIGSRSKVLMREPTFQE